MNKWYTSAWFDTDCLSAECVSRSEAHVDLHGPFETNTEREKSIDILLDESGEDFIIAIVRFDIEGDCVPELSE